MVRAVPMPFAMDMRTLRIIGAVTLMAFGITGARAASADAAGSLLVESDPTGASVYVDGRLAGETPLTLTTIAAGVHRVRVVRLGYLENSRLLTVEPGARATLRARLTDPAPQAARAAALKIVVLEGEGAVNIIQQKTAVAPVIEVRDRNDQPVSGALVRFAIGKGRASFNGVRTLSVTTDAAGRATAAGFTATSRGALQITVSAAFQGQTAAAAIAQTTVMTTAEASSIAAGTGSVSAGGGGLSHTALAGIIGGAGAGIAGAAIASKRSSDSSGSSGSSGITSRTFAGPFNGQLTTTLTITSAEFNLTCVRTRSISGTMTIRLDERADGIVTGTGATTGTETLTANTQSPFCDFPATQNFDHLGPVTGTAASIMFGRQTTGGTPDVPLTKSFAFTGTMSNGVITGTVTYSETSNGQTSVGTVNVSSGSTTFPVTLR